MPVFFHLTSKQLTSKFQGINLGDSGSSTSRQLKNFIKFKEENDRSVRYVVHQYFGNDIEDYITMPIVERGRMSRAIGKISLVFDLIASHLFVQEFAPEYQSNLFSAFRSPEKLMRHLRDVDHLHSTLRKSGSNIIFMTFPFLHNESQIRKSGFYIQPLKNNFLKSCASGDVFYDTTRTAMLLSNSDRIVNVLDAHPSASLHKLISKRLTTILTRRPAINEPDIIFCPDF